MRELILVIAAVVVLGTGCTSRPTGTTAVSDLAGGPDAELLRAAAAGDTDAAARALGAGADIEARDDRERTPLLLAAAGDHVDVPDSSSPAAPIPTPLTRNTTRRGW